MSHKKLQVYQSFWQFSLEVYKQESVKKNCLSLQDEYGLNVNLMLAALWAAVWQQKIRLEDFNYFRKKLNEFDVNVIIPLRKTRRAISNEFGFEGENTLTDKQSLKKQMLSVEIEAEKIYQQQLECLVLNSFREMKNRIHSVNDFKIDHQKFAVIGKENLNSYQRDYSQKLTHAMPSSTKLLSQMDCLVNSIEI